MKGKKLLFGVSALGLAAGLLWVVWCSFVPHYETIERRASPGFDDRMTLAVVIDRKVVSHFIARRVVLSIYNEPETVRAITLYPEVPKSLDHICGSAGVVSALIVFGDCRWVYPRLDRRFVPTCLIFPSDMPPGGNVRESVSLLLPDKSGISPHRDAWRRWADERNFPVTYVKGGSIGAIKNGIIELSQEASKDKYSPMLFVAGDLNEAQRRIASALRTVFGENNVSYKGVDGGGSFTITEADGPEIPICSILHPQVGVINGEERVAGVRMYSLHRDKILEVDSRVERRFLEALFGGDLPVPVRVSLMGRTGACYVR